MAAPFIEKEPAQAVHSGPPSQRTIPSLDGLRALSILLVLFGHLGGTQGFFVSRHGSVLYIAQIGVRIFFVISGFLITTILLKEAATYGDISLRCFYLRRIWRLAPAFYSFLGVVAAMKLIADVDVPWRDIALSSVYLVNYAGDRSWWVAHVWSLCVEEQFYLTWPICLRVAGVRRAPIVAVTLVILAPAVRTILPPSIRAYALFTAGDAIAIGCLLACFQAEIRQTWLWRVLIRAPQWLTFAVLTAFATVPAYLLFRCDRQGGMFSAASSMMNIIIAMSVFILVERPNIGFGRLLNSPVARLIGRASYSLYLWQQLFLNAEHLTWITRFPINVICAAGVAAVSYKYIETRGTQFGSRFRRLRDHEV